MSSAESSRHVATAAGLVLVATITLVLAARDPAFAPSGPLSEPALALGLAMLGGAAALHRPLAGPGLGLGAAIVPLAWMRLGTAPAAALAALTFLLAELGRRMLEQRLPMLLPERRRPSRLLAGASRCALAALAAGAVAVGLSQLQAAARFAMAGATYLVLLAVLDGIESRLGRQSSGLASRRYLPLLLDGAGWLLGSALALAFGQRVDGALSPALAIALALLAVGLLSIEATRNRLYREALARQIQHLEGLGRIARRTTPDGTELTLLAEEIRAEVAKVLPFHWFELELLGAESQSYHAGRTGPLEPGHANPGKGPPPLPGIHRRATWLVTERDLIAEDKRVAQLRLWSDPRLLERDSATLLDLLLPQMAMSIERTLLDREARIDSLTGVAVRRFFDHEIDEAYERACRDGTQLAVILCDLDHFKRINDTFGHDAGDAALVAVAAMLRECGREGDLCSRYGGEEFALLLERTSGDEALGIAERLRAAVAAAPVEHEGQALSVTLSAGVASFPELYVRTPGELLVLADAALYAAKESGRDRCLLNLGRDLYRTPAGEVRRLQRATN